MRSLWLLSMLAAHATSWLQFGRIDYHSLNPWESTQQPDDLWSYPMNTMRPYPPLFPLALEFLSEASRFTKEEVKDRKQVLPEYDFIIVGAGTAGCILANRLTENNSWKVLLIEAGDNENYIMGIPLTTQFLQLSHVNWKHKSLPSHFAFKGMNNGQTPLAQGKVMGGSSTLSYGVYARGHPSDYDRWASMGNTEWSWQHVFPYFKKSEEFLVPWTRNNAPFEEEYHSLEGYQGVSGVDTRTSLGRAYLQAGEQMGLNNVDYNGQSMIGISSVQTSLKGGMKMSANLAFIHPIKHRENLHVIKKSHVTRLIIDEVNLAVRGVEYVRNGEKHRVLAGKEVIMSAGAIGTPHILMLSGIGPKNNLKSVGIKLIKKLNVGFNLMDHPSMAAVVVQVNRTDDLNEKTVTRNPFVTESFLRNRDGLYSLPGGIEALAFFNSNNYAGKDSSTVPDFEIKLLSGTLSAHKALYVTHGMKPNVFHQIHNRLANKHAFTAFISLLNGSNKGRVFLNSSDPFVKPYVYTDYFENQDDADKLLKGIEFVKLMTETEAMKQIDAKLLENVAPQCQNHSNNSDEYWKCHLKHLSVSSYNLCGTCKMGPASDKESVVSSRLNVHGIKKLRVVDSSVIPSIPSADINAAVMMIAEKAADFIKEDYMNVSFDTKRK